MGEEGVGREKKKKKNERRIMEGKVRKAESLSRGEHQGSKREKHVL